MKSARGGFPKENQGINKRNMSSMQENYTAEIKRFIYAEMEIPSRHSVE